MMDGTSFAVYFNSNVSLHCYTTHVVFLFTVSSQTVYSPPVYTIVNYYCECY